QSSIEPRRYTVWLSKANHTYRVGLLSTHAAVHFLTADDRDLAERFGTLSGDRVDKFAGLDVAGGPGGVPVLAACPLRLVGRRGAGGGAGSGRLPPAPRRPAGRAPRRGRGPRVRRPRPRRGARGRAGHPPPPVRRARPRRRPPGRGPAGPGLGPGRRLVAAAPAQLVTARCRAAISGATTSIITPVPCSKPATVVTRGSTWTCQWNGPLWRCGAVWNTTL